jgi:hypothetical protein
MNVMKMSYLGYEDAGDMPYSNLDWHIAVSFPDTCHKRKKAVVLDEAIK